MVSIAGTPRCWGLTISLIGMVGYTASHSEILGLVRAHKRENANAGIRNSIPASRRRCFELLQLPEPPRKFTM